MEGLIWVILAIAAFWLIGGKNKRRKSRQYQHSRVTANSSRDYTASTRQTVAKDSLEDLGIRIEVRYGSCDAPEPKPNANVSVESCWIPAGSSASVHGLTIAGGRIFVGSGLPAGQSSRLEPALINPNLAVDLKEPDTQAYTLGYWPQYHRISAEARAGYLHYLASDRNDPRAPMGFVFLYFYGIERRLLVDAPKGGVSKTEYQELINEIERLLSVYSHSSSFRGYAAGLLDWLELDAASFDIPSSAPVIREGQNGLPGSLIVDLGIFSASHQPIPVAWAYAWVRQDPQFRLRTAAGRCPEEFKALFTVTYRERHGEGLMVKPNKTLIKLSYHPASPSISPVQASPNLPNITILKKPARLLAELVERCSNQLDAYSRFIGKHPARRNSMEALALLPPGLANERKTEEMVAVEERLRARLNGNVYCKVPLVELAAGLTIGNTDKPTAKSMEGLASYLEQSGIGFEPDHRYTGILPDKDSHCVIFSTSLVSQLPPVLNFAHAVVVMRLAGFVLHGQGDTITERHTVIIDNFLDQLPSLRPLEKQHLRAYFRWEIERKSTLAGMRRRVEAMDTPQRIQLEQLLVRLASADGIVDSNEIKKLRRTASLLDRNPESLYSRIREAMAEPTVVRKANNAPSGYRIPASDPQPEKVQSIRQPLDQAAILQKREESEQVASVLHDIFKSEEGAPLRAAGVPTGDTESEASGATFLNADAVTQIPEAVAEEPAAGNLGGLDVAHLSLLEAVAARDRGLPRNEAESLASELRLMLAGAIDTINEAAFELTDAPVLEEEGDVLVVDSEILGEMKG